MRTLTTNTYRYFAAVVHCPCARRQTVRIFVGKVAMCENLVSDRTLVDHGKGAAVPESENGGIKMPET
jgi:hypothetical protein